MNLKRVCHITTLLGFVLTAKGAFAVSNDPCGVSEKLAQILTAPTVKAGLAQAPPKIETLDDLLTAFSNGFVPDLTDASQRDAFEIYRRMRFGNPNTDLNPHTLEEIAKALKNNPKLEKQPFRNFKLEVKLRAYPVTEDLKTFLESQVRSAGQVRSNLFQVEANQGYWKKVFQYQGSKEEWMAFLDKKIPVAMRAELVKADLSVKDRAKKLFEILKKERETMKSAGLDTKAISQAMVDLVHTIGFHDAAIAKALKSQDGLERLNAYRKILEERDSFAMQLGFEKHFDQILKDLSVQAPSGAESVHGLSDLLAKFEKDVIANAKVVENASSTQTVRHLSLVESPYRSCLGGSDCSSQTYLTKALDPNYHYFTLTDSQGFSTGHITVVLGEAKVDGKVVKVAFIDKVQNVSNADLPMMLEGVRNSVQEKGYILALPENLGGHDGISNEDLTHQFIRKNIKTDSNQLLTSFKPHKHDYSFPNEYSRAEEGLSMRPVAPISLAYGVDLAPGQIIQPWRTQNFDLKKLVKASINLKNGSPEEKLRYIPSMKAIKVAGLTPDPEFKATIAGWLASKSEPFKLRKQVLLHEWTENSKPLEGLLSHFDKQEQINLIQNFLDTPRYRDLVLKNQSQLPSLIVKARSNKKVRFTLLEGFAPKHLDRLEKILDAQDINDQAALEITKMLKTAYAETNIDAVVKVLNPVHGTSIEAWLREDLLDHYVKGINSEVSLGRALAKSLGSENLTVREFGEKLLANADQPKLKQYGIVKAFREIYTHSKVPGSDFNAAAKVWIASDAVSAELKSDFLLMHFGSNHYEDYLKTLPKNQMAHVEEALSKKTSLMAFQKIAQQKGILHSLYETSKVESFQFRAHTFPKEGKKITLGSPATEAQREVTLTKSFEMQATPVTQGQWALVMGKNPARFQEQGQVFKLNGKDVKIDFNRPVEQVSWEDAQKFIKKLNETDPNYEYRLPTEAEWEYAARAGTDSAYSFGNETSDLAEHSWTYDNSRDGTKHVASLKPNPDGLYDMHGNVWEWTQDWYADAPKAGLDPTGPSSGSYRVLRGGSWDNYAEDARSASRYGYGPALRDNNVGFRLVRQRR